MKRFLLVLLPLSGCAAYMEQVRAQTEKQIQVEASPVISCPWYSIELRQVSGKTIASGCDREAACFMVRSEPYQTFSCEETRESKERVNNDSMVDRLSMETNCAPSMIKLVRKGAWSRAGEVSSRFDACGKPYVCSSSRNGIDCKAALDQTVATPPPAVPSSTATP